jgi:hypothetical protein
VGWLFRLQDVEHHRDETVHRVGVLTVAGLERVWAERIKGAEG